MPGKLTKRCETRLTGVHPDLAAVVREAAQRSEIPFRVTEGVRSLTRQRALVKAGASQTLRSRHLTGHAADVAAFPGGRLSWEVPLYHRIADAFKEAARALDTPIEWGGDWSSFFDGPHFQLPWASYPIGSNPLRGAPDFVIADGAERRANRLVRPGERSDAVKRWQRAINEVLPDADLAVDGVFGPSTYAAVTRLQRVLGVKADGIIGSKTRAAYTRFKTALKRAQKGGEAAREAA